MIVERDINPAMADAQPHRLLWIDLETTGLHADRDLILEVAARVAKFDAPFDAELVINAPVRITRPNSQSARIHLSDTLPSKCVPLDDFIQNMHTNNGLLADCVGPHAMPLAAIEERILEHVPKMPRDEQVVLAGSTVHFDRGFIQHFMPRLDERLSHRHYDVSSIKLWCQSLKMPKLPKAEAHRALADVNESLKHAEACLDWIRRAFGRLGEDDGGLGPPRHPLDM